MGIPQSQTKRVWRGNEKDKREGNILCFLTKKHKLLKLVQNASGLPQRLLSAFDGNEEQTAKGQRLFLQKTTRQICQVATMVRPEGFEPPTFGSVDQRSIQLSYERI